MAYQMIDLGIGAQEFVAFDADIFGNYIAFDRQNIVHINGKIIHLKQSVELNFPLIRKLDAHRFLLVARRAKDTNAFIFSTDGIVQKSFFCGGCH